MDNIQPGQMIGAYRIVSQIGQGGMATVYKAYHAAMDRYVAVKVLPRQFAESQEFIGRFQQEARTIANLEHPHILPVYDYGENEGITYFVMRFLDTGTLKDRIKIGAMPLSETDRTFTQLAEALGYAHERGVIHRDIKPSNVLVDARGGVFLTDFGIAKLMEGAAQFTATGAITGTPAYMSPEQAQGDKIDLRSDIYSLGIVLYEMITGRVPFEAETPLAVILKQLQAPLPPPSSVIPDISPEIERVLLKALAKDRNDRYPTCGEFLEAWRMAVSASDTVHAARPAISPEATMAAPPPAFTVAKAKPGSKKEAAQPEKKRPNRLVIGGGAAITIFCCCVLALGAVARNRNQLGGTAAANTATSVAQATAPSVVGGPTVSIPTVVPGDSNWTSWTAGNIVWGATIYNDQIAAWGPGGISLWDRFDGTLRQRILSTDGLPAVQVNYLLADEDRGGLWAATEGGGLGFFDGERWTRYNTDDGLDSDSVTALALTSQYLLVGTSYSGVEGGGLLQFNGQTWEPVPGFPSAQTDERPDLLSYNVQIILPVVMPDSTTVLWVGTANGLGYYDGQTWRRYSTEEGLPSNNVWVLIVDDNGDLLAGTEGGAARFNGESFEAFEQTLERPINGIVQDANSDYWFSGSGGLARYSPANSDWEFFSTDSGDLEVYTYFRALRDPDTGSLYFGSDGTGLVRTDLDGTFTPWAIPNQPRFNAYSAIVRAPDGSLWFAEEYGDQTDRYDLNTDTWSAVELPCSYCVPLAFQADGSLWLGGEEGLWFWPADGSDLSQITTEQGLPDNHVYSLAFTPDGHVLAGTYAGLAHLEGLEVTAVFNAENSGLASDYIRALYSALDGTVWVGTDGGLSRLLPDGSWEHFTPGNPFGDGLDWVQSIVASADGALWAGTGNNGAWRLFDGKWEQFDGPNLLSGAAPDFGGGVWFGSYYSGAWYFNGNDVESYEVKDGLIHPNVNDIYVDDSGTAWFATSGGVTRRAP
ncbi:MAG: protein kinase [Chloroflexi bacterium]|nr:protein kinase [Chloroflexota bacterium]